MNQEPKLSREQGKTLIDAFLKVQRLTVKHFEDVHGCVVARIKAPNGNVIGSVTLPPGVFEMAISDAQKTIQALVLDACRACAGEPAARG